VSDEVGSAPQYEVFADEFLEHARDGLYNAHYDRPACLELLGDVAGKRVLDAACGPGLYAEELVRRGATVAGCDISERMVALARERVPRAELRVHDLGRPLDWVPDASFDLVLCALAIEYVDDRIGLLREFERVLKPGGALVLSRPHPTADWVRLGGNYFETRIIEETWSTGWNVRYWLAPLQQTCDEIFAAGFLIERLVEPRPAPDGASIDPEGYELLSRRPTFIALRLVSARARA
jgi:SAM-dependent methyltransferase